MLFDQVTQPVRGMTRNIALVQLELFPPEPRHDRIPLSVDWAGIERALVTRPDLFSFKDIYGLTDGEA